MTEVIFVKHSKVFLQVLKTIQSFTKNVILQFQKDEGLFIKDVSDSKVTYYSLLISCKDIEIKGDSFVFGIEIKQLINALRDITTLKDVIVMLFSGNTLKLVVKTKKSETESSFENKSLFSTKVSIPLYTNGISIETSTKELEDILKKNNDETLLFEKDKQTLVIAKDTIQIKGTNGDFKMIFNVNTFRQAVKQNLGTKLQIFHLTNKPLCLKYNFTHFSHFTVYMTERGN